MTQDSDDLLALVFAGVPPPSDVKINGTTHVESRIETTHVESHHIETRKEILESGRRASQSFMDFVESTGVIDHSATENHHEEHHETNNQVTIGFGAVPTQNGNHRAHDDDVSVVSEVSHVSHASSVSVHSSVSQKSAQVFHDNVAYKLPVLGSEASTVSEYSLPISEATTLTESSASSQATTINKYNVNIEVNSVPSTPLTPVAPQKSFEHDAVIEQFKKLHHPEPSVTSSVPSRKPIHRVVHDESSDDDESLMMTVKVTQYEFDSGKVEGVRSVVSEPSRPLLHHDHEPEAIVYHAPEISHAPVQLSHFEEPRHHHHEHHSDSEESFKFEPAQYVDTHAHRDAHSIVSSVVSQLSRHQETAPVFFHNSANKSFAPTYAPPPPRSASSTSSSSSSDNDTLGDDHHSEHHHHHHHHQASATEHRGLVPNVVGPRVRDEFRPVTVHKHVEEVVIHRDVPRTNVVAPRTQVSAPIAHVHPVVHVEKTVPKINHHEQLTPMVPAIPIVRKRETVQEEIITHHGHDDDLHKPHHHEEIHHHHVDVHHHQHGEPVREDDAFIGLGVKNLRSMFEHGSSVEVNYAHHNIHRHQQISHVPTVEIVVQHHEPVVEVHVEPEHHHEHHHEHAVDEEHHHHHHHEEHEEHHHHHHHEQPVVEAFHDHPHYHQEEEVHAVEEDQQPVSALLGMFGGGARFRTPDHVEDLKKHKRTQSIRSAVEVTDYSDCSESESEAAKSRSCSQSTVTITKSRGHSVVSLNGRRSHAPTLSQIHEDIEILPSPVSIIPQSPAPISAPRVSGDQFQSVRVVKSVRAFVSQWGQKDFVPPTSPVISAPRLSVSSRSPVAHYAPEPTSRKSTVVSHVSDYSVPALDRKESIAISHIGNGVEVRRDSVATSVTVVSEAPYEHEVHEHHHHEEHHEEEHHHHNEDHHENHHHEEHDEEFVLTPLSQRRAMFEGASRSYSINRKNRGELRPMVNLTD